MFQKDPRGPERNNNRCTEGTVDFMVVSDKVYQCRYSQRLFASLNFKER